MSSKNELLKVNNLSRYFGEVAALVGVSFEVGPGEVLGVVGLRGSGKSTLFNLLSGVLTPSSGEIYYAGRRVLLRSPERAHRLGIETVHQASPMAATQNAVQNLFMGREICVFDSLKVWPKNREMQQVAEELFASFNISTDLVSEPVANLTTEEKQIVALGRGLCRPAQLLLMDDPLAALSYERQQILLERIKELAAQNCAIIISSDDLKHIFAVTDQILVLYQGKQVALHRTSETTPREVVELIVGSDRQEQVTPVIWAFESYHAAQQQAEELRIAQSELRQNLEEQDSLNRLLVERLRDQVKALDNLNLALQVANRRLMTEREAERKALARDLHDQVIQDLLSYSYQLEGAENDADNEDQQEELAKIRSGIRQVVSSLRQVCSDLRPPTIDSQGLSAAIRSLIHEWSKQSGIQVELDIDPELGRLPEPIELSVFRIIQEGLSNVRKHANASQVRLVLQRTPTASLVVRLADDGQGIARPINLAKLTREKHFGLVGIGERVSLLGGTMRVDSPAGVGLELLIEIPSPYPTISA